MPPDPQPDWERIVADNARRVFRVALRILGSAHDAEDVSQDVFVEAHRLNQAGGVRSWTGLLVRLATLRAIDRRRRSRQDLPLCDHDRGSAVEPFQHAAANELAEWLRAALVRLPDQQAAVFALVYFEQLSRDEIAASLKISPQAVSTALYKARQRLMSELSVFDRGDLP